MQIDWTTLLLEILNFLVLVWILKHFFYQPVLAVLDRRKAKISEETDSAARLKEEAEALKIQYEVRMKEWVQERERLRRELEDELTKERERRHNEMKQSLAEEAEGIRAHERSESDARKATIEHQVEAVVYGDASAMLKRLASPSLTESIVHVLLTDLAALAGNELAQLRNAAEHLKGGAVEVTSAHPLSEPQQKAVTTALSKAAGHTLPCKFTEDPLLIAGLRIVSGECVLHANLADEMAFFRRRRKHE